MSVEQVEPFLGAEAAQRLRSEIGRAGGNEVCFVATVGDDGEIGRPRVVARGNSSSVLAAIRTFKQGEILIHNHPSGHLSPSQADLSIAERLWAEGLGFAITNNQADALYVVVAPPPVRERQPIDLDQLRADLAPGGVLSRGHPNYENRESQRELSTGIARLYSTGGIALYEAGTGIGKSVAYLLPAIRWAVQNRERTVVSTNTINLQEQLVRKDLPFLERVLGVPFRFALVKGRNNYVSIRRARLASLTAASLFPDNREAELQSIVQWLDRTSDGSLSDLPFRPSPEVWDEVASESDVCLRAKCPHFESCFYQRSRRDAASADILVVNHHLLFSDLAVREAAGNFSAQAVLPHYQRLILDEAHNLEETATRHLGASLTRRGYYRTLRRVEHRGKGVLPAFEKALVSKGGDLLMRGCLDLIEQRLRPELEGAWKRGAAVFHLAENLARSDSSGMMRLDAGFADHPIWSQGLEEELGATLTHLEALLTGFSLLRERVAFDEQAAEQLEEPLMELRGVANRVEAAMLALRAGLRGDTGSREMVRWIEYRRTAARNDDEWQGHVQIAAAPLDLAEALRETLWERIPTVAMTSATLATRDGFDFLKRRLGLEDHPGVEEAVYPSPFDFESQSILALPRDVPPPTREADHADATLRVVGEMAEITDGGIVVLFTSYRALRRLAEGLRTDPEGLRWPLFVQGEAPRGQILQQFVESGRGILLGTDSFWEGVDVPGHPLRALVIPKLPFKVPSEPVTAARIEAIEARGENSFGTYMLPHAAIRLKQGFGRLIRSRSDQGSVVILDSRIITQRYGRYLVDSLPPARLLVDDWEECRAELARFHGSVRRNARHQTTSRTADLAG